MSEKPRIYKHKIMLYLVALTMIMLVLGNSNSPVVYADTATSDITINNEEESSINKPDDSEILSPSEVDMDEQLLENEKSEEEIVEEELKQEEGQKQDESLEQEETLEDELPRSLASNEIVITSYSQLRMYITNSGGSDHIDTYYLGNDITMEYSGIKVPYGYSFTIDGRNPETQKIHSIREYSSNSFTSNIYYEYQATPSNVNFTLRNLRIDGASSFGLLRTRGTNITQTYENVSFIGSQFAYAPEGSVVLSNVDLWIKDQGYLASYAATANSILLKGNSSIKSDTYEDEVFMIQNEIVFDVSSNVEIKANKAIVNRYSNLDFIVRQDAYVKYNSDGKAGYDDSNIPYSIIRANNLIVYGFLDLNANETIETVISAQSYFQNYGTININVNKVRNTIIFNPTYTRVAFVMDNATLNIRSESVRHIMNLGNAKIMNNSSVNISVEEVTQRDVRASILVLANFIVENSTFYLRTNVTVPTSGTSLFGGRSTTTAIKFIDSKVSINAGTRYHESIFNVKTLVVDTSSSDDSYFILRSASPNTKLLSYNSGEVLIASQQVNVWSNEPSLTVYPDQDRALKRYSYRDNRVLTLDYTYGIYTGIKLNKGTSTNLDYGDFTTFNNNGFRILAIGSVPMSNTENTTDDSKIIFDTNANAWVKFGQAPRYIYAYADSQGKVNHDLDISLQDGEYNVSVYSNYLLREDRLTYHTEKPLEIISVPSSLNFGTLQLKNEASLYGRQDEMKIVIGDGRNYRSGWKLSVYVESPLQIKGKPNTAIHNGLVYKNNTLSSKPVVVYETEGYDYEDVTEIIWSENEGIQLFIESYANILVNENYEAKLVWVLEEK